jgi:hypothetical protein
MHLVNDPVIFRGKPNYVVVDINDANPSDPMYLVADKNTTDRLYQWYSFWVPDEDLESATTTP